MPASQPPLKMPYRVVEAALLKMHGVAENDAAAFRARLGGLQKGGLLGVESRIGKGKKLEYGVDEFRRMIMAIELVQAGFSPGSVLRLVKDWWEKLNGIFNRAEHANMHPARDNANDQFLSLRLDQMFDENVLGISHTTRDRLPQHMDFMFSDEQKPARVLLVNISAQLRKFHAALAYYNSQSDQSVEAALAPKAKVPKGQGMKPSRAAKK